MSNLFNIQTRISQAFSGGIDQMDDVCKNYLNTKKDILVEETKKETIR